MRVAFKQRSAYTILEKRPARRRSRIWLFEGPKQTTHSRSGTPEGESQLSEKRPMPLLLGRNGRKLRYLRDRSEFHLRVSIFSSYIVGRVVYFLC